MPEFEVRQAAQAWVASFAPLVMESQVALTDVAVRERLAKVEKLRIEGPGLKERLGDLSDPEDANLRWTVEKALDQLESIEIELRKRLAKVAPGDPAGRVDLDALRERLSERAAKQEVGLTEEAPTVLRLDIGPGNLSSARGWWALAAFSGIATAGMGLGGLAAIGEDFMPVGVVLFGLAAAGAYSCSKCFQWGFKAASSESIELDELELKLIRNYKASEGFESHTLAADCAAAIEPIERTTVVFVGGMVGPFIGGAASNQPFGVGKTVICMTTKEGDAVRFGASATDAQRASVVEKINTYLKAYGR